MIRTGPAVRFCLAVAPAVFACACGCARNPPPGPRMQAPSASPAAQVMSATSTAPSAAEAGLQPPRPMAALQTVSPVPVGWKPDPPEHTGEHDLQTWISPTGRTAYGVIAFHHWLLPLASDRLVLGKFLDTMRQSEGEARLVSVRRDAALDGLRFVAEGGKYTVRGNLVTRGTRGWVVYAGTLRAQPVMAGELELAEQAREQTRLGLRERAAEPPERPSP